MVLMVVPWHHRMPLVANGWVSMLVNVTFYEKLLIESE